LHLHGSFWLEVVSKCQIAFESKAQADEKAQHTCEYVSILKRSATQLSDTRWGFETTSKNKAEFCNYNRIIGSLQPPSKIEPYRLSGNDMAN